MTNVEYDKTLTEVSEVLKHMSKKDVEKIPNWLLEFIEANKDCEYEFEYNKREKLENQKLMKSTLTFLAMICLNYWSTPEEKVTLHQKFQENENKYQSKLKQLYNSENIFKKTNKNKENVALTNEISEKWYKKALNKIKAILKIKNNKKL